jgi:GTP pyrophosphokinase
VAENKINIIAAHVEVHGDHTATVNATLQVASLAQLARVLSRLETVRDVFSVQRALS